MRTSARVGERAAIYRKPELRPFALLLLGTIVLGACSGENKIVVPPDPGAALGEIPRTIAQDIVEGENVPSRTFEIRNSGACPLDFTLSVTDTTLLGGPWLSVSPTSGQVAGVTTAMPTPAPSTITVTFATTSLPRGVHSKAVVIRASCTRAGVAMPAAGSPLTIEVTVNVRPYTAVLSTNTDNIYVDPGAITASSQWRTIAASGGPDIAYSRGDGEPFACWTGAEMLVVYVPNQATRPNQFAGWLFDPLTERWRQMPPMPAGGKLSRSGTFACSRTHLLALSSIVTSTGIATGVFGGVYHFATGLWGAVATFPHGTCSAPAFRPWKSTFGPVGFAVMSDERPPKVVHYSPEGGAWSCDLALTDPNGPRQLPTVFEWTGENFLILGGTGEIGQVLSSGLLCHISVGLQCVPTSTPPGDPPAYLASLSTGSRVALTGESDPLFGAYLDPFANRWAPFPEATPLARYASQVWNGQQLLVWGGLGLGVVTPRSSGFALHRSGAITPLPTTGAPSARHLALAVWTGQEMLVWGGYADSQDWLNGPVYALQ